MNWIDKIVGRTIRKDRRSRNRTIYAPYQQEMGEFNSDITSPNNEDDDIEWRGPHRKAKENEQWQKFKTQEGKTIIYLKKKKPSMDEVENILSSPFLDGVEKDIQLTNIGASGEQIRRGRLHLQLRRRGRL